MTTCCFLVMCWPTREKTQSNVLTRSLRNPDFEFTGVKSSEITLTHKARHILCSWYVGLRTEVVLWRTSFGRTLTNKIPLHKRCRCCSPVRSLNCDSNPESSLFYYVFMPSKHIFVQDFKNQALIKTIFRLFLQSIGDKTLITEHQHLIFVPTFSHKWWQK